jgi:hypothetical protein
VKRVFRVQKNPSQLRTTDQMRKIDSSSSLMMNDSINTSRIPLHNERSHQHESSSTLFNRFGTAGQTMVEEEKEEESKSLAYSKLPIKQD